MKTVSIIVPCYNEEKALPYFFEAMDKVIPQIEGFQVGFILVNDGSKDKTLETMQSLYEKRNDVTYISLTHNFGQNPAFSAGLANCTSDYAIMMDADLQDPAELLVEICKKFQEGYEVVSPHRVDRSDDTLGKRTTAGMFYRFTNWLEGKKILPENVNCFRGLSRRAIDAINALPESDRLLVGEIPFVGMKTCYLDFTRQKRVAGKSKYNYSRMFSYALDIISSNTAKPLYRLILAAVLMTAFFGLTTFVLLIVYILSACSVINYSFVLQTFFILSAVFLAMSIVLDFIGILAIYLHNILINTRHRPNFLVDELHRPEDKEKGKEE